MSSKVIYVSDSPANLVHHAVLDIISPKEQDKLLESGWFITKSEKRKVNHPTLNKKVTVDRIELSDERGVAVGGRDAERPVPSTEMSLVTQGFNALAKALSGRDGPPGSNENGYLGRSIAGQVPGVGLVTSMAPNGAFGMGADTAKRGGRDEDCPFPEGSMPFGEWLKGYLQAGGRADPETMMAMQDGRVKGAEKGDHEVTCRWAPNTRGYIGFVIGFQQGGGKMTGNGNV